MIPLRRRDIGVRSFLLVAAVVGVVSYVWLYTRSNADNPIHSDGYSYYVYVPSILLYHDPALEALSDDWYGGRYPDFTGILRWRTTGRFLNPHPIGTALLMSPFVLVGHALTWWSNFPLDGFSFFYQQSAALAGFCYMLAGLALLGRTLSRHFSPTIVVCTLAGITWGTNLFHYGVFDGTFSHVFAFFLVCALLELTEMWWATPTVRRSIALGVVSALLFLTRHTDLLFLALVPLYGIDRSGVRERAAEIWRRRHAVSLAASVALLGIAPQLLLYRHVTGAWLVSPYAGVGTGFQFASPHIFGVLFSTQKGLFFWSPVLMLSLFGVLVARGGIRRFVVGSVVTLVIETWLIASWSDWQFGASYGHRAFTDGLGLMALFVASSLAWAAERPRWLMRGVYILSAVAVGLSTIQMLQYWMGLVPTADTTWEQYRALFLRLP
jgi:hypothetical protein